MAFTVSFGQWSLTGLTDVGESTTSYGIYFRPSVSIGYEYKAYEFNAGIQTLFTNVDRSPFSGWFISGDVDYEVNDFDLTTGAFIRNSIYANKTRETNIGIIFGHQWKHIDAQLGFNVRLYSIDPVQVDPSKDHTIWEYRNFVYRGMYWVMDRRSDWNLGAGFTNYDWFIIQQETNPALRFAGFYYLNEELKLMAEWWMQPSGMLNLHADLYGYFFRIGVKWQPGN